MKVITIGRAQGSNDIVVSDEKVSRHHLQLIIDDFGNVKVNDMGSTNGTFVNGTCIMGESPLFAGDQLRIGDTVLQWQSFVAAAQNATPPVQPMPPVQPTPPQQPPLPPTSPKPRRRGLVIVLSLVGVLITGVVVWKLLSGPKDDQNIKKEAEHRDSLRDAHNGDSIPGKAWDSDSALNAYKKNFPSLFNSTSDNDGTPSTFWQKLKPKPQGPKDPFNSKEDDNNTPTTKDKSISSDDDIKGAPNSQQPPKTPTTKTPTTTPTPDNSQKSNNTGTQPPSTNGKPSKSGVNLHGKTQNPNNGEKLKNDQANTHTAPTI